MAFQEQEAARSAHGVSGNLTQKRGSLGKLTQPLGVSVSILTASCRIAPRLRGELARYVFSQPKLGNCRFSLGLAN